MTSGPKAYVAPARCAPVLHLLNGDALRTAFAPAGLPGDVAVCGDMLSEGPVPGALAHDEDWQERALELEQRYDLPSEAYLAQSRRLRAALADAAKHEEVTLWFDQDLFCVVNLVFCLQTLAAAPPARLSLVFPPVPLGAKQGSNLRQLWDKREDARHLLAASQRTWRAYAGADPQALLNLGSDLPWTWGLSAHLDRFPAPDTGLNAMETATLRLLRDRGPTMFGELFQALSDEPEMRALGSGDLAFAGLLRDLAAGPKPLVSLENAGDRRLDMAQVLSWEADLEPLADAVLRRDADAVRERGVDRWLGGVHLLGNAKVWRWNGRRLGRA